MALESIAEIYRVHPHLKDKTDFVYTSCQIEWIVIFSKLSDTKTNEERDGVVDPLYAKFRASHLKVEFIFNKNMPSKIIDNVKDIYVAGKTIQSDTYDLDLNKVDSFGIQYYKSIEPAYYAELPKTNKGVKWFSNGQKEIEKITENSIEKIRGWHQNGQLHYEYTNIDGTRDGHMYIWDQTGEFVKDVYYEDGKIQWIEHQIKMY